MQRMLTVLAEFLPANVKNALPKTLRQLHEVLDELDAPAAAVEAERPVVVIERPERPVGLV